MICPYCMSKLPDDAEYCTSCGTVFQTLEFSQDEQASYVINNKPHKIKKKPPKKTHRTSSPMSIGGKAILAIFSLAFVIGVAAVIISTVANKKAAVPDYEWPSTGLAQEIPKPTFLSGQIKTNTDQEFEAEFTDVSDLQLEYYKSMLEDADFCYNVQESMDGYSAITADDVKVTLNFYEKSTYNYTVDMTATSNGYSLLEWPTTGLGAMIPAPDSQFGEIIEDTDTCFYAKIYEADVWDSISYTIITSYIYGLSPYGFDMQRLGLDSEQESAETEVFYMLWEDETTWTGTNADGYIISVTGMNDEKIWIIKITAPEKSEIEY